jgi:hypothetical protein
LPQQEAPLSHFGDQAGASTCGDDMPGMACQALAAADKMQSSVHQTICQMQITFWMLHDGNIARFASQ